MLKKENERGSSLVGTIFLITIIAFFGAAIIQITSQEGTSSIEEMQATQAKAALDAGNQRASNLIFNGSLPNVTDLPFEEAVITTTSNASTGQVSVTAKVGNAVRSNTFTTTFAQQCMELDVTEAHTSGPNLMGIKLIKKCDNAQVILIKTKIDWDWGEDSPPFSDPGSLGHMLICHDLSGDSAPPTTLDIPNSEWATHQTHPLDYPSPCGGGALPPPKLWRDHKDHDHWNTIVTKWGLEGSVLYDPSLSIGLPAGSGANPNEWIDGADATITGTGSYYFKLPDIVFGTSPPKNGMYEIELEFADGSHLKKIFQEKPLANCFPGMNVDRGEVKIDPQNRLDIKVLGINEEYGVDGSPIPVTMEIGTVDDSESISYIPLFGGLPVSGGEIETVHSGSVWVRHTFRGTARYNHLSVQYDSKLNLAQVVILMNGTPISGIPGFGAPDPIADFLIPYIAPDNTITLGNNQALILYEFDTTDQSNVAYNLQDLVVLLTVNSEDPGCLPMQGPGDPQQGGDQITPQTGGGDTYQNNLQITIKGK